MATVTRYDRQRIYPTLEQEKILRQILDCSRVVYNKCVDYADKAYRDGKPYPGYYGKGGFKGSMQVGIVGRYSGADITADQPTHGASPGV